MIITVIMKILTILYVVPIVIVPIYFNKLIPSFFELSGYTFVIREEMTISYFCFPVLGLILSIICIIISSKILSKNPTVFNKIILMSIFSIITINLEIPPMKILLYSNYNKNILFIDKINNFGSSLLTLSIISLVVGIYLFLKEKIQISEYIYSIKKIFNIKL